MNLQLTHKIILYLFILNLGHSNVLFTDITSYSGINFSGSSEGVCLFDYNNDGWDDIFFTARNGNRFYLYRNEQNMFFTLILCFICECVCVMKCVNAVLYNISYFVVNHVYDIFSAF